MQATDSNQAAKRAEYMRKYQAKRRADLAASGVVEVRISLTAAEFEAFTRQREKAGCPVEQFAKLALTRGAAFVANAGNARGGKVKEKGVSSAR